MIALTALSLQASISASYGFAEVAVIPERSTKEFSANIVSIFLIGRIDPRVGSLRQVDPLVVGELGIGRCVPALSTMCQRYLVARR